MRCQGIMPLLDCLFLWSATAGPVCSTWTCLSALDAGQVFAVEDLTARLPETNAVLRAFYRVEPKSYPSGKGANSKGEERYEMA